MKKGVIFDMDGTIWDSSDNVAKSWDMAVKKAGYADVEITRANVQAAMGKTMDGFADRMLPFTTPGPQRNALRKACEEFENEYLREHGGILFPRVLETLAALKAMGYGLYVVSNCQSGYIEAFLSYYGIPLDGPDPLFSDIECYGNNSLSKGQNIALIAKRNHLDAAVYVGDIQSDYESTCEAGLPFIHAAYGFGTIHADVPAIHTFADLTTVVPTVI